MTSKQGPLYEYMNDCLTPTYSLTRNKTSPLRISTQDLPITKHLLFHLSLLLIASFTVLLMYFQAEILETTFRSRFRLRFFLETFRHKMIIRVPGNVMELPEIRETKKLFPVSLLSGQGGIQTCVIYSCQVCLPLGYTIFLHLFPHLIFGRHVE